jgi:undecaprenyl-diphosphatase
MINLLAAFILGIVQGITEWLPISSTAHMLIFDRFIRLEISQDARSFFFVVVQLGSILAVIVLYFKDLWPNTRAKWMMWAKIAVATVPLVGISLFWTDALEGRLQAMSVIALALIAYGVVFILVETIGRNRKPRIDSIYSVSFLDSLALGLFQSLSVIPGTSRSGSTIMGGRLLGLSRQTAAKLSFFMAIPAMAGASLLKVMDTGLAFNALEWAVIAVGCLTSFAVSLVVLKSLMDYVKSHTFVLFGIYRIVLAAALLLFL